MPAPGGPYVENAIRLQNEIKQKPTGRGEEAPNRGGVGDGPPPSPLGGFPPFLVIISHQIEICTPYNLLACLVSTEYLILSSKLRIELLMQLFAYALAPTSKPISQPTSHTATQPSSQPTSQPTNQPASQPTNQVASAKDPTNQSAKQPTNQPTNQATNQTNQPTNQPPLLHVVKPAPGPPKITQNEQ